MVLEYTEEQSQLSMQPPRPPNCFMVWAQEKRKEIGKSIRSNNNADTSIMLGKIWSSMPDKFKLQYRNKANDLKYEHRLKYPNYKYQPKKKEVKCKVKNKENNRKIRKYVNKQKLIKKNIINKEIVLNDIEEPDYFNQVQQFYENIDL